MVKSFGEGFIAILAVCNMAVVAVVIPLIQNPRWGIREEYRINYEYHQLVKCLKGEPSDSMFIKE